MSSSNFDVTARDAAAPGEASATANSGQTGEAQRGGNADVPASQPSSTNHHRGRRFAVIAAAVAAALAAGIVPRLSAHAALKKQTATLEVPAVQVTKPTVAPADQPLLLPADIEANQQTPIFARTNGYLKAWYADIGAHVKAGQLLAVIDAPEVDAALRAARADEQQALANDQLAQVTASRWQQLVDTHAVSQQETDIKVSDAQAKHAALLAAQSNVARLAQMQSYEKVYAPFDGVVTARNVDVGALIDAGSTGGPAREMFDLAQTHTLRVYADVPQNDAQAVSDGTPACLVLTQQPGECHAGTVVRNSGAINPSTRTLRVEVDVPNDDGAVLPGSYGQLRLTLHSAQPGLSVPVNALLYRPQGVQLATVDARHRVVLKTITPGRDFGTRIEVAAGVGANDQVILNPSDSITGGEPVRVVQAGGAQS
ncbi:efflux RND transporter periplasmic adaptor subunit [Paraburkholderia kururiensis]|uniref:Efflux RND transporter periplasmic adaptor subunit n=1 Tax=Paraburkholderia kururiensis TaxID=984307 RepID=A0ABZ0WPQ5_9BURK|nr:efflux RND transporter periplasmic adaptor subunit [Paraburkholderia kururiensis]WQD79316.1 efflux RND transporter periplasmic adaptor subunit [Paraburkholderia kururiensis]